MDPSEVSTHPRYAKVLKRCPEQIGWYERHAGRARAFYRTSRSARTGVIPARTTTALREVFERYDALPATLASVLAAVIGLWSWQENGVRFAATAEALKSELVQGRCGS